MLAQGHFGLPDDAFYADPAPTFDQKVALLHGPAPLLVLDGPRTARVAVQDTIPYLGASVAHERDVARAPLRARAALLTQRFEDGLVRAGWAFRGAHPDDPLPAPSEGDPGPAVVETFTLDLRARLEGLPWDAGTYTTWLVLFDRASNPVVTAVKAEEPNDPEVRRFLEAHRRRAWAGPVSPPAGDPLPCYRALPSSPPVPATPGVALAVERVVLAEADAPVVLRGSFRLPVRPGEVVRPLAAGEAPDEPAPRSSVCPASSGRTPSAVLAITLLLVGDTRSAPRTLRLDVPTWDPVDAERPGEATGHFALDLRRAAALDLQTHAVWAIAGGALHGPVLSALVDPGLVPTSR